MGGYLKFLAVGIAGACLPLAFAPLNLWPVAIVSLAVLFQSWLRCSVWQAFWLGLCFGIGFFGIGVSWVFVSIHDYGYTAAPLAALITILFVAFLALIPASNGVILRCLAARSNNQNKQNIDRRRVYWLLCCCPASYVLLEWLRSWLLTGFPWLLLGDSQLDAPLAGYAPIVGVYGVSLLIAFSASILVLIWEQYASNMGVAKHSRGLQGEWYSAAKLISSLSWLILLAALWSSGQFLQVINWSHAGLKNFELGNSTLTAQHEPTTHTVSLVQGNLTPDNKFLLDQPFETVWNNYALPSFNYPDSELIIWPENSLPVPLPYAKQFIAQLDQIFKQRQQTLIVGLPIELPPANFTDLSKADLSQLDLNQTELNKDKADKIGANPSHYNSLIVLGNSSGRYDKQHLVPFGEYLPFDKQLRGLINFFDLPMSNFKPGASRQNQQPLRLNLNSSKLLPLICYEIAFPQQVRNAVKQQAATAILTISEDGWFGDSFGPQQHLAIARMRALENGRYVIRSTTSGISAIINAKGKIVARSPQFKPYVLTGQFINYSGITPWTKYGQWPLLFGCGFLLLLAVTPHFARIKVILRL